MAVLKKQRKRGRPALTRLQKIQRLGKMKQVKMQVLRAKIATLKLDFRKKLNLAKQQAFKKALLSLAKLEQRKVLAKQKALNRIETRFERKFSKRLLGAPSISKRRGRPPLSKSTSLSSINMPKRRGRPRKVQ
jgi:AT hook motif